MKKVKMTKAERIINHLQRLLERRDRQIAAIIKKRDEEIYNIRRGNRLTQFKIDSIKKGEWPL